MEGGGGAKSSLMARGAAACTVRVYPAICHCQPLAGGTDIRKNFTWYCKKLVRLLKEASYCVYR